MHPWRPISLVGIAFAAVSLLFPFVTLPLLGVLDGISADAWPALLPLLPVAFAAALGDWTLSPRPWAAVALILLACSSVLFSVVKVVDANGAVSSVDDASLGAGPLVLLAGAVITLAGCVVSLSRS
jgi:hypothetical protein